MCVCVCVCVCEHISTSSMTSTFLGLVTIFYDWLPNCKAWHIGSKGPLKPHSMMVDFHGCDEKKQKQLRCHSHSTMTQTS